MPYFREYDAALIPLKHVPSATASPGSIPARPASHPAEAPFGHDWHAKHGAWSVETYACPAAYPRSIKGPGRKAAPQGSGKARMTKEEIQAIHDETCKDRFEAGSRPVDANLETGPNPLWIVVNKYAPGSKGKERSSGGSEKDPMTLLFAHANGFSRETWEPTIANLIAQWDSSVQGDIHEIWSLDMINQGDSALLNKDTLDTAFDWADNGRDILQFVLSYLPEASSLDVPTVQLSPVPPSSKKARLSFEDASLSHWSNTPQGSTAGTGNQKPGYKRGIGGWTTEDADLASTAAPKAGSSRSAASSSSIKPAALQQQPLPTDMSDLLQLDASAHSSSHSRAARTQPASRRRWRGRRIALIGHSVGAAGMIFTASTFPQLFESIVLVDPTIFPTSYPRWSATVPLVNGAIIRRTQWASREEAKTLFAKNKGFYGRWDKDILEGYVQYGLTEDEQGVTLKVDRMQEAYVYADVENYGSKRAFHRLGYLPATLNVHFIRADVGMSTVPEDTISAFHEIVKHATHTRIAGAAHLIAQEKPRELASEIVGYLSGLETPKGGVRAKL